MFGRLTFKLFLLDVWLVGRPIGRMEQLAGLHRLHQEQARRAAALAQSREEAAQARARRQRTQDEAAAQLREIEEQMAIDLAIEQRYV